MHSYSGLLHVVFCSYKSMPVPHWIIVLGAVLLLKYILAVVKYNIARRSHREGQIPLRYPAPVPFLYIVHRSPDKC